MDSLDHNKKILPDPDHMISLGDCRTILIRLDPTELLEAAQVFFDPPATLSLISQLTDRQIIRMLKLNFLGG